MTQVATHGSSTPLPVALLWKRGWPPAALLFWSRIGEIENLSRDQVAVDASHQKCDLSTRGGSIRSTVRQLHSTTARPLK